MTLLDVSPTLLHLAGFDVPVSMSGRVRIPWMNETKGNLRPAEDDIVCERLTGLGYL